jgi:hypothetical protein
MNLEQQQTIVMLPQVQPKRLQLVVDYLTRTTRYYPIPEGGWRIDGMNRQIVIGRGVPRTMIPFDTVAAYHLEEI